MPLSLALFRWFFRSLFQVFKSLIFLTTSSNKECHNFFPIEDFRGFWICWSIKNSASIDTKFSFLPFFPGWGVFFTFNYQTIIIISNPFQFSMCDYMYVIFMLHNLHEYTIHVSITVPCMLPQHSCCMHVTCILPLL